MPTQHDSHCIPRAFLLSFFFFYLYGHPRVLHSFPTRRSSDLGLLKASTAVTVKLNAEPVVALVGATTWKPLRAAALRSEEHTSELQSRRDLVCRLLLEKKKQTTKTTRPMTPTCVYVLSRTLCT